VYKTHVLVFDSGFTLDGFNFHARFQPSLLNTALFVMKAEMEIARIIGTIEDDRLWTDSWRIECFCSVWWWQS
jgi:hypothetical protein